MKLSLKVVALAGGLSVLAGCSSNEVDDSGATTPAALTASVSLRIPIVHIDGQPLSSFNADLDAVDDMGQFPETVEVTGGANGNATPGTEKAFHEESMRAEKAGSMSLEILMQEWSEPASYKTKNVDTSICFKGDPKLVVQLITTLRPGVFSDNLRVHGWRTGSVTETTASTTEQASFGSEWATWNDDLDTVLVVTSSSQGGDKKNAALIPRCR